MRPSRQTDLAACLNGRLKARLNARSARRRDAFDRAPHGPRVLAPNALNAPNAFCRDAAHRHGTAPFHPPCGKTFDRLPRVPTRIACPIDPRETLS
ncbi:hypothetical protein [Burkholderia anthina]|uniref:hypothetical protein n=1 Tax=Burkholderia anthina TaxID=179879 RepID=UPI001AA0A947|nr:hypothetical protein [Burkholderia anthina]QTD93456.1 hypothetical protein J4G50_21615 [Burkholderia anthina]